MKNKKFEKLINNDLYQVFLLESRAHIPLSVWTHSWVVINKKGQISRYEVRHTKNNKKPELGHIHINDLPPFDGIEVFLFLQHPRWNAVLLGQIQGAENSLAQRMCGFIEASVKTYRNKDRYSLFGPNSNTYIQWMLNSFPEFTGALGRSAFGSTFEESRK